MSWVLAFVGFAALILLHELGHFLAAKAVGMQVEKFSLFFGPMLVKVQRGETTYGIGPIPLGGYVKISGMNPAEELPPEAADRAYHRQPVWKRIVVIAAGPAMNLLIAFVLIWGLFAFKGQADPDPAQARAVSAVEAGSPADGRLRPGDRIVSIDGVRDPQRFPDAIGSHRCAGEPADGCLAATPATVVVERDGAERTLRIRPFYDAENERSRLGFSYGYPEGYEPPYVTLPAGEAAVKSAEGMWNVTRLTVETIGRLFYDSQAREEVSGVVGSYEATRQAFSFDTTRAIEILALISLSLAVINLFPFLPLDGGHIFWALAEKVRGRPIPFSVMERAGFVGFALVAMLFVLGLTNDIGRLTGEGFDIR
ncbi:MAG: site-2 protease family protein [Solirubrobacteraceae bacterium]|nr:site-2 protease family protein [Solirubrobacteraceae bacterium]